MSVFTGLVQLRGRFFVLTRKNIVRYAFTCLLSQKQYVVLCIMIAKKAAARQNALFDFLRYL